MTPQRIQRKRVSGWRMPENARYVGRPSIWANPFIVQEDRSYQLPWVVFWSDAGPVHSTHRNRLAAKQAAVDCFQDWIGQDTLDPNRWSPLHIAAHVRLKAGLARGDLAGRDLVCWCRPDDACHGDVLLRLAANNNAAQHDTRSSQ